jgi:hypothetical protein
MDLFGRWAKPATHVFRGIQVNKMLCETLREEPYTNSDEDHGPRKPDCCKYEIRDGRLEARVAGARAISKTAEGYRPIFLLQHVFFLSPPLEFPKVEQPGLRLLHLNAGRD